MELMLSVDSFAPSGTTGMSVFLLFRIGYSSFSKRSSNACMCLIALSPSKGIEPWAIFPNVSISAHQTPLCPKQIRSLFRGSGMITWSILGLAKIPFSAR